MDSYTIIDSGFTKNVNNWQAQQNQSSISWLENYFSFTLFKDREKTLSDTINYVCYLPNELSAVILETSRLGRFKINSIEVTFGIVSQFPYIGNTGGPVIFNFTYIDHAKRIIK